MRLINARTLQLEPPRYGEVPRYAILSHTWEEQEVTLQEFISATDDIKTKKGYAKIVQACHLAIQDHIEYVWVDTCCIDKTSSTELAEAINSMFRWYRGAVVCYAYLSDWEPAAQGLEASMAGLTVDGFDAACGPPRSCRWFKRGWTLQELVAPGRVEFFDKSWKFRGEKGELTRHLHQITGIQTEVLMNFPSMYRLPIIARMSWASRRKTTRVEDRAYCLMGIFGVNMPLLYGEGEKAFTRLQHEIIKLTGDISIFGWSTGQPLSLGSTPRGGFKGSDIWASPLLARSPSLFQNPAKNLNPWEGMCWKEYSVTNVGIRIKCCLVQACWVHPKLSSIVGIDTGPPSQPTSESCDVSCEDRFYALELSDNIGGSSSQQSWGGEWGIILHKLRPDWFVRNGDELVWLGPVRGRRNNSTWKHARTAARDIYLASDSNIPGHGADPGQTVVVQTLRVGLYGSNLRFRSAFPETRWDFIGFDFFLGTVPWHQRWGIISVQVSWSAGPGDTTGNISLSRSASLRSQNKSQVLSGGPCRPCIFFNYEPGHLWILDEEQAKGALGNIRRCGSDWSSEDVEGLLRDEGLLKNPKSLTVGYDEPRNKEGGAIVTETIAGREICVEMLTDEDGSWRELHVKCMG